MNRRVISLAMALLASISLATPALAHPLHTTITEIVEDRSRGTVRATIRVFADDFGTAVTRSAKGRAPMPGAAWDQAALAYITSSFALTGADGRALALRPCGIKRTDELLWICVEAASASGLGALKVRHAVLCDLFSDQVNVVQATVRGARRSLLFTRGDAAKPIA